MTPELLGACSVAVCVLVLLAGVVGYVLGWQDAREEQRVDELCAILDRAVPSEEPGARSGVSEAIDNH